MNSVQLTAQKKRISAKCQQCVYKPICNGGCPKHRITKVNNETVSYFCEGYKILFFNHGTLYERHGRVS